MRGRPEQSSPHMTQILPGCPVTMPQPTRQFSASGGAFAQWYREIGYFTYTIDAHFEYTGCSDQFIEFLGADDAWIYVDGSQTARSRRQMADRADRRHGLADQ